ncbi:flagellar biosynthetic protein FliO [Paraburkholderia caballeronis]|uniref:Flagellar protein n=1 Tax=Paraburkholderia caballeronis TaxID=416943 RepID=A0A1H7SL12_9BURK|nr:flagellar biosynthetic protein FliO [Paraburkholderia caballeronis]PXW22362.1 flagellar protein FliO/FliZ [Paraburkholderia caballeronis]PXW96020.1 flagellar protein FliO/FliZ [Paraburkholderia caballeronis]RAJ92386.1 flagellar protein FliO/FliZ [Paraburkholderia caballeronis]SEB50627.1 flagellar protein FliO/FliZ [Paraburkholderia caballeronis]SEL73205.1 flagellar protein FliO/FliZ [Paraburkholderia caballeronis]
MKSAAARGAIVIARRGAAAVRVCIRNSLRSRLRAARHAAAILAALAAPFGAHAADLQAVNQASRAASVASAVGAGTAVPSLGFGALLQSVLGLAVVLAVVFGCAWLARRLGLQPAHRNALVKTVGGASLGGKERVAVVEVGDTWLVLGAAPGNVRLLHTMPAGALPDAGAVTPGALPGTFGQRFRDALKGEVGKRFGRPDGGAK